VLLLDKGNVTSLRCELSCHRGNVDLHLGNSGFDGVNSLDQVDSFSIYIYSLIHALDLIIFKTLMSGLQELRR
jgi:hypothetical protein